MLDLLSRGAEPNDRSGDNGWTPLHVAAYWGHTDCVSALLLYGADVNAKCLTFRKTALQYVVLRSLDTHLMSILLYAGADINSVDSEHRTVLHHASWMNKPTIVRFLLDNGARPSIVDRFGRTAFQSSLANQECCECAYHIAKAFE